MLTEDPAPRRGPALPVTSTVDAEGVVTLVVAGEVDSLTAPDLQAALDSALADPACRQLRLDLSAVTFMSSAGLSVLIVTRERTRTSTVELQLVGLAGNRAVRRPLELTGMLDLFTS